MAFRRARQNSEPDPLEILADGPGLVVQGSERAVTRFIEQIEPGVEQSGGRRRHLLTDGFATTTHLGALDQTHREYFEFSEKAKRSLADHGLIPSGDGYFHGFVKADGKFAGNLTWKPVDLGPEKALAFQNTATHMALKAAVNDLTEALERVEGKVDNLIALTRAKRLGKAVGDRRTLDELVRSTRKHGRISRTDWSTVDSLGAQIARDIEELRAYILGEVADLEPKPFVRTRSSELGELTDELLRESMALLVVVEHNYMLWQETRIDHVASHESEALSRTILDVKTQMATMTRSDQDLVDALLKAARKLLKATGLEGLLSLEKRRLEDQRDLINDLVTWFAEQRHLDSELVLVEYPTVRESAVEAVGKAGNGLKSVAEVTGGALHNLGERATKGRRTQT